MAAKGGKKNSSTKRKLEKEDCENITPKEKKSCNDVPENKIKTDYGGVLSSKYGIEFPDDMFWFYKFVEDQNEESDHAIMEMLKLKLTGPFDILNGKIPKDTELSKTQLHLHGRFFTDSPEMHTVLFSEEKKEYRLSYYRDSPSELPSMVVCCKDENIGELTVLGDNLFAACFLILKDRIKTTKDTAQLKKLKKLSELVENRGKELGYSMEASSPKIKERNKKVVTKSLNKIGLVVPVDKSGVGYRELHHSDRELKKLLTRITEAKNEQEENKYFDELQETITFIQFANDECDYGMGLELGIDLFVFGHERFHGIIGHLLPLAYQLLKRDLFADVIEAHLKNRQREGPISMV